MKNRQSVPDPDRKPAATRALDVGLPAPGQIYIQPGSHERQSFIDQAAIALHARGVPLVSVFRKATELWDARVEWLKQTGAQER